MSFKLAAVILIISLFQTVLLGQVETYTINKVPFSSDNFDEFSPAYYKDRLVFSTTRNPGLFSYSNFQDEKFHNIYYIDIDGIEKGKRVRLFSRDLATRLYDGPVTFSPTGDSIYYARNLFTEGKLSELSSPRNKLGIFYAVREGDRWTSIRELRFNNQWYNTITPALSPDGKRLYFASDMPEGYGGFDLYYCEWKDGYWGDPVNLGPVINTSGNEAYPFIKSSGEILFSSDGHPGLGGMDIFYSRFRDTAWLEPVRLDHPINSEYDDFGIITDDLMFEGYFSSNRDGSFDIYNFKTNFPQVLYDDIQQGNQYCFIFRNNGSIKIDIDILEYRWHFGEGNSVDGAVVEHCFQGPGLYNVRLDIVDKATGNLFFNKLEYSLELRDIEQVYIHSPDISLSGEEVIFDGTRTYLPGYEIMSYSWDFENGNRSPGETVKHTFIEEGEYIINLILTLRSELSGTVRRAGASKKIVIVAYRQEKESLLARQLSAKPEIPYIEDYENARIYMHYSAEDDIQLTTVFAIEVLSSGTRVDLNSRTFERIPDYYRIRERFIPDENIYSYAVDQRRTLAATYPAYREMLRLGFEDVRIRTLVLQNPVEKELYNTMRVFTPVTDTYFDASERLTSSAYIMLDQIVRLMNQNPSVRIEVGVHSDNIIAPAGSLATTQRRAQIIVDYLVNRGISANRLVATGFGINKPVAPYTPEEDRKLNRRIEFIIIDQ